jgi:hypothetical protein
VKWCRIRYIGSYYENDGDRGRRRHVFCNRWRPAQQTLAHEITMTSELKPWILAEREILRGPKVSHFLRPDATVTLGDEVIHFENDMNTEQPHVLARKTNRYLTLMCGAPTATVVFIAPNENRLDRIKEITRPIASICLYKLAGSDVLTDINGVTLDVTELT